MCLSVVSRRWSGFPVLPGNTVKTWESPYMGKVSAESSSWSPLSGPSVPTVDPGFAHSDVVAVGVSQGYGFTCC